MTLRTIAATALAAGLAAGAALAQAPEDAAKGAAKAAKGAAKGAPPAAESIARVNGVAVPKARLEAMVVQQQARGTPDSEQLRGMVREELINREVLAQEATKTGVAKRQEVQTQMEMVRQEILINAYIRDWLRKNPVTDADIEREYERAKSTTPDKEYRARHILVETEDQAKDLIAQLKKGAKFEELAAKNSKDTGTKDRGGDLDWTTTGNLDRSFADAMSKLEKGKHSETPVRTRFGFHVIQLDDTRSVRVPALAEIKPRIQQQLVQVKIEEMVRGLRAKAKVE
jgi:peptidyl-prolyl cis-trans isomerase C